MKAISFLVLSLVASFAVVRAGEHFIEAETFQSAGGWEVRTGPGARSASGVAVLQGAGGAKDGVATTTVNIKDAGRYFIWVRYSSHPKWRGPFHVTALAKGQALGEGLFDAEFEGKNARDTETWRSFDAVLPDGEVTLQLSKHENKNSAGPSRLVDCLLLTMDDKLAPNHLHYGAQTFVRVTFGEGHEKPAYIHIFADHYHAPWYQHYSLGKAGAVASTSAKRTDLLKTGESTPWCNLTPMIYQDSGAMLYMTARHTYTEYADKLRATFEFATAPDEKAIVRTLKIDNEPGTVAIFMPPNLLTPENLALFKTDREIAEATGKLADTHAWPTHGKFPQKFPFYVSAIVQSKFTPRDADVLEREEKTLSYFGFSDEHLRHIGGAWHMKDKSFCNPDLDKMRADFARDAAGFKAEGGKVENITFCELMDEPTGQPLEFAAQDPSYAVKFREWLKAKGETPESLLVKTWDEVKIVTGAQRDQFPALYYFSQKFRTRALGDFIATQRKLAEEAYGGTFPVLVNFSDGAVYVANFYAQGVDYFELLESPDQNAIWGEDWSSGASTYQCASFNVDLMRAAARERGQVIGHHLVAYAGRKGWDVKLKATSEAARGVKIFNNFCYGPSWATHEGGPYWRSSVWQAKPETWTANASITREFGAVEDLLVTAMPAPAKVALLYSSASDVWAADGSQAHGFDRMHTWIALSHAQMPVDVVSESQVARDLLKGYDVCYLSGPNLTRAAAEKLKQWVLDGGTLWLTAGAASRDEYNRPLGVLEELLPAKRGEMTELQRQQSSGRYLSLLATKDEVSWEGGKAMVLSVKQALAARETATTLGSYKDGSAALVRGTAGKGTVYCSGFLPALSYIKTALDHRDALQKKIDAKANLTAAEQAEAKLIERSYNPWKFPAEVRDLILIPAREAKIKTPIRSSHALVDAVYMPQEKGILIPLANYTLEPIEQLSLTVVLPEGRRLGKVESAMQTPVGVKEGSGDEVQLTLPLENNDFLKLMFE